MGICFLGYFFIFFFSLFILSCPTLILFHYRLLQEIESSFLCYTVGLCLFVLYIVVFIGRTDAGAEAPILWPPDAKSQLTRKDPNAGKDWGQKEKALTEDEMVGWHHRLNGHEFEQTPGDSEGQGSLACCSPWSRKESDTTEWVNSNNIYVYLLIPNSQLISHLPLLATINVSSMSASLSFI